jgi:zinc resistance-associated protein
MKKLAVIVGTMTLVSALALPALAAPPADAPAYGPGYHRGMNANLTPEQAAEAQKARAEFATETQGLRQKMAAKGVELRTLYAQPTKDTARIKALSDEMVDLQAALGKKRNEFAAKYPNAFGPGMGRGMGGGGGRGMGGGMMGGGMMGGAN